MLKMILLGQFQVAKVALSLTHRNMDQAVSFIFVTNSEFCIPVIS